MSRAAMRAETSRSGCSRRASRCADGALMTRDAGAGARRAVVKSVEGRRDASCSVGSGYQANVRFAANQMSTAGGVSERHSVAVQSAFGQEARGRDDERPLRRSAASAPSSSRRRSRSSRPTIRRAMPELRPQQYHAGQRATSTRRRTSRRPIARRRRSRRSSRRARRATSQAAGFLVVERRRQRARQQQGTVRLPSRRRTRTTRSPCARPTAPARAGRAPSITTGGSSTSRRSATRAIEKARLSRNPVAIEPGRYTVILEPQAVGDLVQLIGFYARRAHRPTKDAAPFAKQGGGNKIGEKIVDQRVTHLLRSARPAAARAAVRRRGTAARPAGVDRERRAEAALLLALLGAEAGQGSRRAAPTSFKMIGGDDVDRRHDQVHAARHPRHAALVSARGRSAHDPLHGPHARRHVPHRERQDHEGGQELPLQRVAAVHAQQPRGDRSGRSASPARRRAATFVMPPIKVRDFNFTSSSDAV